MIRIIIFSLFLGTCIAAPVFADRVFVDVYGSHDSDEASLLEILGGYQREIKVMASSELSLAGGERRYHEPGASRDFSAARLQWTSPAGKDWQLRLRSYFLNGDRWSPTLPGAFYTHQLNRWYLELSAERDVVDAISAIDNRITVDSYTASADYKISDRWTVVGAGIAQRFSDDNRKNGGVGRIIYTPERWPDFNLQLKGRILRADKDSPDYFSPETQKDIFFLVGYARPFADDNWVIKLLGGPGVQAIDPFFSGSYSKDAFLGEVNLRGWMAQKFHLTTRLGCTTATATRDTYRYCYGSWELAYVW